MLDGESEGLGGRRETQSDGVPMLVLMGGQVWGPGATASQHLPGLGMLLKTMMVVMGMEA